ncbi:hypothetical protein BT96DRAFT_765391, partial [Gymnopus androsaceus JB14]
KGFLQMFSAWVFEDGLPFTTGKSKGLRRLFEYLKINFALPTDTTVRRTLNTITETLLKSKIVYSYDSWTTRQMVFSFAGILAHWIDDDWKLIERLVDFQHLEKQQHAG